MKRLLFLVLFLLSVIFVPKAFAEDNSFVSIINPVRGNDFWDLKDQQPATAVIGQKEMLNKFNLPATWLIRFDALGNQSIINVLKNDYGEKGLFLEVTPTWATAAKVTYNQSDVWHGAGSAFLTGYGRDERVKLIDSAFDKFKSIFGYYPVSVGAWWIDAYSLGYLQEKYGVISALIVSDQYSTDNYQIWGQYFSTPYYPSRNNVLHPAQTIENKLPVVMVQWAARDPVNAYGNGVFESTFSVQANDYIDYHKLDTTYFSKLLNIYIQQQFNQFSQVVIGLENSYSWAKYKEEYMSQIQVLIQKQNSNQIKVVLQKDFANWYRQNFPKLSPEQIIVADDPLKSFKKAVWFMNPYYRAGWFLNSEGSVFRDIRQYIDGQEELCFKERCSSVNFATSATRVLDDVSFGDKWIIDEGKMKDFNISKKDNGYLITYINEAGNSRQIEFLPRDIRVDNKISSIDGAILDALKQEKGIQQKNIETYNGTPIWSISSVIIKIMSFLLFLIIACLLPGMVLTDRLYEVDAPFFLKIFLATVMGLIPLTVIFYIASLLNLRFLFLIYIFACLLVFFRLKIFKSQKLNFRKPDKLDAVASAIIIGGTIFQVIPTFKSGLSFNYGIGFWGPNTHDGVWHVALINQLMKSVPPENPIFSGTILKNYHFFYDLLVAATSYLVRLPVSDLVFRFYPVIFSLSLGIGSYYLVKKLFENQLGKIRVKVAAIFSLFLIYFAGSFGWIAEYLREKHFGGESAFWANQAVSFNLNPPYAISLIIMIALLYLILSLPNFKIKGQIVFAILAGTLISFKSYTGILVLGTLFLLALVKIFRQKDFRYLWIAVLSTIVSVLLFLPNFELSSALVIFAPFWFIHSMIDSPDRVGWARLSLARATSYTLGHWPKFIGVEILGLVLFIIGNLGMRFLSFGLLVKIKDVFKNDVLSFLFFVASLSIIIPVLFIQSGNPWNTIQFFYTALYISALFSGVVISILIFKLNKISAAILISVILILAPINSVVTANGYLTNSPHAFISRKELEVLKFLSGQPDGIVLTIPYDDKLRQKLKEPWPLFVYGSSAYVSALSKKSVFLEDEPQNQILLTDYKKREVASKDFFLKPIQDGSKFLHNNHISYIYIPKIYNLSLDGSINVIKNIFENEEVVIYSVK